MSSDEIDLWYESYSRDIFKDVDGWYEIYRRDFMPKVSGRVFTSGVSGWVESRSVEICVEALFRGLVVPDGYKRVLVGRVRLNRAILENPYWFLPFDNVGHEDFEPVGRGSKSSDVCGRWRSFMVCKNISGHDGVYVDGVDCSGKVVVRHKHWWCHKATCSLCFNRGWSVREAGSVVGRLEKGAELGFGVVEHVSVSVPPEDYGLPEKVMREKCRSALLDRGVIGAGMIFHGFRIDRNHRLLVWSPHYHCLGYILGGFDGCRGCVHERDDCCSCSGFKGREVRGYKKDRYLVKVFGERKTVFGTVWYQLNHATVRVGFGRFHVVTYFGVCGNRKFGSPKVRSMDVCPACGDEMVRCAYMGRRFIARNIGDADYKAWFVDDEFDEDGEPLYPEIVEGRDEGG
jgi:hypothetical protein